MSFKLAQLGKFDITFNFRLRLRQTSRIASMVTNEGVHT